MPKFPEPAYSLPDTAIVDFIKKHHLFTLATSGSNRPYVCSCFYVYLPECNLFVFTSDDDTHHVKQMLLQPMVAGAIALETLVVGKIQGIQFTGKSGLLHGEEYQAANLAYLKKFPVAGFKKLTLWKIEPDWIKMTHNKFGFGRKLLWQMKDAEELK